MVRRSTSLGGEWTSERRAGGMPSSKSQPSAPFWLAWSPDSAEHAHYGELVTAGASYLTRLGCFHCRVDARTTLRALQVHWVVSASTDHGLSPPGLGEQLSAWRRPAAHASLPYMSVIILDGPMGTELTRRAVPMDDGAWSALALDVAPDVVAAIHRDYAAAGAVVHTANTFRTKRRDVGERWEALARRAVKIAKDNVPAGQRVAGSIAPLADCYRPDRSPGAASASEHAELARALAKAGVDILLCETFAHADEAAAAVRESVRTGAETWVAFTGGPDGSLMTPEAMGSAAARCAAEGARVVLVNCTPATRTLRYLDALGRVGVPFGAYANAGSEADCIGWGWDAEGASRYAVLAAQWVDAGASVIGGCCGTGPAHIASLTESGWYRSETT